MSAIAVVVASQSMVTTTVNAFTGANSVPAFMMNVSSVWNKPVVDRLDRIIYTGKGIVLSEVDSEDSLYDGLSYALSQGADYILSKNKDGKFVYLTTFNKTYNKMEQIRKTFDANAVFNCYSNRYNMSSVSLGKESQITLTTYVAAYRNKDATARYRISKDAKATTLYNYCAAALKQTIKSGNTDIENLIAIRNHIVKRTDYGYLVNGVNGDEHNAYGALVQRKAVCAGYSRAFCLLMRMSGYKCWIVAGLAPANSAGKKIGHSWNAYRVNGHLYFTDCTWADGGDSVNKKHMGVLNTYSDMVDAGYEFFLPEEDVERLCKY